jgi:hypothetical protein
MTRPTSPRRRALHHLADPRRGAAAHAQLRDIVAALDRVVKDAAPDWRSGYVDAWLSALNRLDTLTDRLAADIGRRQ